jgi:hypothetical protein
MKSILDPSFRYIPSSQTDLRKTFARERRRLRTVEAVEAVAPTPRPNVVKIVPRYKNFG